MRVSAPQAEILVVDNDEAFVNEVSEVLLREGFRVRVALDGEEALKALADKSPSIVLTGTSMPPITGVDLIKAARKRDADTPVIVMAAQDDMNTVMQAVSEGALPLLRAPLREQELVAMCHGALEVRKLKLVGKELQALDRAVRVGSARVRRGRSSAPRHATHAAEPKRPQGRADRMAMERAALARLTALMSAAVASAPTRTLEQALAEPAPSGTLAGVLTDAILADPVEGEWHAALLRGARAQRELLEEAGGALSAEEVGKLLGIGRAAVDKRRRHGTLLGLKRPSGDVVYPAAQFRRGAVLPGLPETLRAFRISDPWMQLEWLVARDAALQGRTVFEALAAGETDRAKAFVGSAGDQGL
jgi:DNA-binding response OmpR family regulator